MYETNSRGLEDSFSQNFSSGAELGVFRSNDVSLDPFSTIRVLDTASMYVLNELRRLKILINLIVAFLTTVVSKLYVRSKMKLFGSSRVPQ